MAALLNSLSFVFQISFLVKYRLKYYDYIVKWCGGIACRIVLKCGLAHLNANVNVNVNARDESNASAQQLNQMQVQMQMRSS